MDGAALGVGRERFGVELAFGGKRGDEGVTAMVVALGEFRAGISGKAHDDPRQRHEDSLMDA